MLIGETPAGPVTVMRVPAPMITVPPAAPGPVLAVPALSVRPGVTPRVERFSPSTMLPLVSVIRAAPLNVLSRFTLRPAQILMLPSVVVMVVAGLARLLTMLTSCPALNRTLPLTEVMASLTLISCPQHATRFPLVGEIAASIFTFRRAFNVRVVGTSEAPRLPFHATSSLILISPLPTPGPATVVMLMSLSSSEAASAAPVMLSPGALPTVKSTGSISQVPVSPFGAAVVTRALS